MDKIWDRKSFEVGGHWPLWQVWMTTQNRQKTLKKTPKNAYVWNRPNVKAQCSLFTHNTDKRTHNNDGLTLSSIGIHTMYTFSSKRLYVYNVLSII